MHSPSLLAMLLRAMSSVFYSKLEAKKSESATLTAKSADARVPPRQISQKMPLTSELPQIAILLGTRNGARFLEEQLNSFLSQTYKQWFLYVSDDASTDDTRDVIARFANQHDLTIDLRAGPNAGFSRNFVSMTQDPTISGDFFAFSDQDDVWYDKKLERALEALREVASDTPAMYCSRTELVDENNNHRGYSRVFQISPSFRNALVQNIGGGNTMVFNLAAKKLLEAAGDVKVVSHDWWVYQVITGVGGTVIYDPSPTVKYRQHDKNIIGANNHMKARFVRVNMLLNGRLRKWNDINASALHVLMSELQPCNRKTFEDFKAARSERGLLARLYYLVKSGVHRQTIASQMALFFAACIKRI